MGDQNLSSTAEFVSGHDFEVYEQLTNLFELSLSCVPKVRIEAREDSDKGTDPNAVYRRKERFVLADSSDAIAVDAPRGVLRDFVARTFERALVAYGFRKKGRYIVYLPKEHEASSKPFFAIYPVGFEYRIIARDNRLFLVVDPHVALSTSLTINDLLQSKLPIDKLAGFYVTGVTDEAKHLEGFLRETRQRSGGPDFECVVHDDQSGKDLSLPANSVKPEATPETLQPFLDVLNVKVNLVKLHQQFSFLHSTKASQDRLNRTLQFVKGFAERKIFPLRIGKDCEVGLSLTPKPVVGSGFLRGFNVSEPNLLFSSVDPSSRHQSVYHGLRSFGPYDKKQPVVRLLVVTPPQFERAIKEFVEKLNRGTEQIPKGVKQFLYTEFTVGRTVIVNDPSPEGYRDACEQAVKGLPRDTQVDTAIVVLPKQTSKYYFITPYYVAKAVFASHGIPTQMLTPRAFDNAWGFLNIATAIYAKAGAIPWALDACDMGFDMILGLRLSNAVSHRSRIGGEDRFMGCANVFDRFGRWMFFEGTTAEAKEIGYTSKELTDLLGRALKKYSAIKQCLPKRVALHYYKRFSKWEIDAVCKLLKDHINDFELALINIDDDMPFRLYDKSQGGVFPRGGAACLGDREFLLCTTGKSDLTQRQIGTPKILHCHVRQIPEPFIEIEAIAQQIVGLTKLDYATLTAVIREPVTLAWAGEIAKYASVMSSEQWNGMLADTKMSKPMENRLWFL